MALGNCIFSNQCDIGMGMIIRKKLWFDVGLLMSYTQLVRECHTLLSVYRVDNNIEVIFSQ